ncbi:MAG: hypothetical protein K0R50_958 [Eubacterium sp.]|nr:hypothetical protein [Eubacterium sp.]
MVDTENSYFLKEGTPEETLFIPLLVKAKEYCNKAPLVKDSKAFEISQKIRSDSKRFDGGSMAHVGILTRCQLLDKVVADFIQRNTEGIIINLGVGLDTRFDRFDNGKIKWFDLDLPEVINLRRIFFSENARVKYIGSSVTDLTWADEISVSKTDKLLIIAEGLLMYLTQEQVINVFKYIHECFPAADFYFDVVHSYFTGKAISSQFIWGLDQARDIYGINNNLSLVEHWSIGDFNINRQGFLLRILNLLPATRNRSQILHVTFK